MQVTYKKKLVKNLGNYESIAVEIGIEDSIDLEVETFEEAYSRLREVVNFKLKEDLIKVINK